MEIVYVLILLTGLGVATITDLKTREVPDWLSFGLIATGVGFHLLQSIYEAHFLSLFESFIGLIIGGLLGMVCYYLGQWGGGDAKLLMGVGAFFGVPVTTFIIPSIPLFLVFLVNMMLAGALYGMVWIIWQMFRRSQEFKKEYEKLILQKPYAITRWTLFILIIVSLFLGLLSSQNVIRMLIPLIVLLFYMLFVLLIVMKAVEKSCMIKKIKVSALTEGDWIIDEIAVKGKHIVGPKDLGISREQIALLKKHAITHIRIKEGIPFVPTFLIAYVGIVIFQNWLLFFF